MQCSRGFVWPTLLALVALGAGCASTGVTPRPFPIPGGPSPSRPLLTETPANESAADGRTLVDAALELRGIPYRNGGSDLRGFDCSGLTQYVFARHGRILPREVRDQFRVGEPIARDQILPGDLVFFSTTGPGPSHVAIAVSIDEFVHAPSSSGVVRIERIDSRYWMPRLVGIRRLATRQ